MNKRILIWLPTIIAIAVILGITIGSSFTGKQLIGENDRKLNTILNIIKQEYVDTVDVNDLVERTIPKLLTNLDPHSTYIPAKELVATNDELLGSFSGIGVSFFVLEDTVTIESVIPGGPSEKVGLLAGDRIIKVDDKPFIGVKIDDVPKSLKGEKGTVVKLEIKRNGVQKPLTFDITRGDVPVSTVDVSYMIDKKVGYIKINKFGMNTYNEFLSSMLKLKKDGADKFIIDLRGNSGGFMDPAILIANEFLPEGHLIVYTKGREKRNDQEYWSDGHGTFTGDQLIVLIDESSASASEILAGAIQDNDRGLLIGRRSFGKGLIQQQIPLPDNSAMRLTIGRYYTPSGRCIQKNYSKGKNDEYSLEIFDRYTHGEFYNKDSIKVNEDFIFETIGGRKVYGYGGIIPDIFVPNDTSGITDYYIKVFNAGLIQKFVFKFCDINRVELNKIKDYMELLKELPSDEELLRDFSTFAARNGVPRRPYYVHMSSKLILPQIKGLIAREIFGNDGMYPILNNSDTCVKAALDAFKKNKAVTPITIQMNEKQK